MWGDIGWGVACKKGKAVSVLRFQSGDWYSRDMLFVEECCGVGHCHSGIRGRGRSHPKVSKGLGKRTQVWVSGIKFGGVWCWGKGCVVITSHIQSLLCLGLFKSSPFKIWSACKVKTVKDKWVQGVRVNHRGWDQGSSYAATLLDVHHPSLLPWLMPWPLLLTLSLCLTPIGTLDIVPANLTSPDN
ncbi:hypothetical protein B0F90DRAFT_1919509 [Multifurca ochricompacta]|uniref:Uncharacterized protein n=1 Tax=Multifurca ochricompacta TaxID=376703 RepID=A0AAD4LYZ6_9AGAM|nr:hypothetical protein B0F90DRAFT_1919509 [Multifurca ochricompacta]